MKSGEIKNKDHTVRLLSNTVFFFFVFFNHKFKVRLLSTVLCFSSAKFTCLVRSCSLSGQCIYHTSMVEGGEQRDHGYPGRCEHSDRSD